jgi:hypothetical protein
MLVFHRVFQGHHVHGFGFVDLFEHGGQGGGFTAAGGTGDQDDAVFFLGHLVKGLRAGSSPEWWESCLQFSQNDGIVALLGKDVDPEAGLAGQLVGEVAGALLSRVSVRRRSWLMRFRQRFPSERGHLLEFRIEIHRVELSGAFHLKGFAHRDVQVRHVVIGSQHTGQDMVDFLFFMRQASFG